MAVAAIACQRMACAGKIGEGLADPLICVISSHGRPNTPYMSLIASGMSVPRLNYVSPTYATALAHRSARTVPSRDIREQPQAQPAVPRSKTSGFTGCRDKRSA